MEIFLLKDVPGVGKKNDLLIVGDGYALYYLLPRNIALVATPVVRKRYAEFIKRRAEERETERAAAQVVTQAIAGKSVSIARKATKTGKLYAALTEDVIAEAIKSQLATDVSQDAVKFDEAIKALGSHPVTIQVGETFTTVNVIVTAEK